MEKSQYETLRREAMRCPMMQFQGFNQDTVKEEQKQQMIQMYGNMVKQGMHAQITEKNPP